MFNDVLALLENVYHWPVKTFVIPGKAAVEAAFASGMGTSEIAARVEAYARGHASTPPYGYPDQSPEGAYTWYRKLTFGYSKYRELFTQYALGLASPPVEDIIPEAKKVEDWWIYQENNRTRKGELMLSLDTPEGREERAKRWLVATKVPPEWELNGAGLIWQLAVREGNIRVGLDGFAPMYHHPVPSSPNDVAGLTAQQYLDNMRCEDRGTPHAWAPTVPNAKVPA